MKKLIASVLLMTSISGIAADVHVNVNPVFNFQPTITVSPTITNNNTNTNKTVVTVKNSD